MNRRLIAKPRKAVLILGHVYQNSCVLKTTNAYKYNLLLLIDVPIQHCFKYVLLIQALTYVMRLVNKLIDLSYEK